MRKRWFLIGSSVVGLTLAAGCGGSSGGKDVPIEEVPQLFAEAQCTAVERCFGPAFDLFNAGQDCVENAKNAIEDALGAIRTGINDGRIVYNGDRAEECFDGVAARGCEALLAGESEACQATLAGTVDSGGDCTIDEECRGVAYCKVGNSCPGECVPLETANGECDSDSDCAAGLECSDLTGRCTAPAEAGARCGGASEPECAPGFFCIGEDEETGAAGTCRSLSETFSAGVGASCSPIDGPFCEADLSCAIDEVNVIDFSFMATCRAKVGSGQACQVAFPDMCPSGEFCQGEIDSLTGVCTRAPVAGEPCARGPFDETDSGEVCAPGTLCDGGTCRGLQRLGGSCQSDDICLSENCDSGTCASSSGC